jgi:hypothetical protein
VQEHAEAIDGNCAGFARRSEKFRLQWVVDEIVDNCVLLNAVEWNTHFRLADHPERRGVYNDIDLFHRIAGLDPVNHLYLVTKFGPKSVCAILTAVGESDLRYAYL